MNIKADTSLTEKYNRLSGFAKTFWPDIDSLNDQRRLVGTGDVLSFLYTLPLAIIGILWLIRSTDLELIQQQFLFLLFNFGLLFLFSRLSFFTIIEIRSDRYGSSEDSLASMIQWSVIFLLGPTALWLSVIFSFIDFAVDWRVSSTPGERWSLLRTLSTNLAVNTFAILVSLIIYKNIGGEFPIPGLTITSVAQALITLISQFFLVLLIISGYLIYHIGVQRILAQSQTIQPLIRFFLISAGLPYLAHPFSILLAGLLIEDGFVIYAFLLAGLVLVAYLARRLSMAAEKNRQQSKQLEKLEKLGRELLEVIPDSSSLPAILEQNVPGMFPSGRISIWISPNRNLLKFPADWIGFQDDAWQWIITQAGPKSFLDKDELPWQSEKKDHLAMVTTPIFRSDSGRAIGGIAIELRTLAQPWDIKSLSNLFPATQALADQISSTLQQTEIYEKSLDYQQITQELRLAGQIQASFLPNKFPRIPGWQLAVTLLPARETSGDFFDVIELSDDRLGILVADVADKGVGSALYMALSRTLMRTYAEEYDAEPEVVCFAANNRLLKDARANLFITLFYGILDPNKGTLTYCNAGHNPPYLIRNSDHESVESLTRTGIAMGIEANSTWITKTVTIETGDILVLYTDGIPDAQDRDGDFFNDEAIIEIVRENTGRLAHEIQSSIINEVQKFSADTPQDDDITLMVLVRDK
jgi:serine phosphatase RsbU (regulator of sigma subunit)